MTLKKTVTDWFINAMVITGILSVVPPVMADVVDEDKIDQLVQNLTLEEKVSMFSGANFWTTVSVPRLDIPSLIMSDGPTGVRSFDSIPSTVFPVGIAVAATWNPELIEKMAASLGREARAMGINVLLAPMVNIQRTPLGGRNFEGYSEDPYLAGQTGAAFVRGVQSEGVGTSLKHFVANNQEYNRLFIDTIVSDRALREIYLATFEHIVKAANPWTVMSAYNQVNGRFMSAHKEILTDILKGEWNYDGLVVSDWGGTHSLLAAEAGLDLEMPGPARQFGAHLLQAVKDGKVSEAAIDKGVKRLLRLIERTTALKRGGKLDRQKDQYIQARAVANEAITLLKNEGNLLPLNKANLQNIAIIGPNADAIIIQGGGSSHVVPARKETPLEAITKLLGDDINVSYAQGTDNELIPPGADYRLFSPTKDREERGLQVSYYKNQTLTGDAVNVTTDKHFEKVGFGTTLSRQTQGKFSVRWSGFFFPPKDGTYEIHMIHTGAAELRIGDQILVSPTTSAEALKLVSIIPARKQTATIELKAGKAYPLEMTYRTIGIPFQFFRFGLRTPRSPMEQAIEIAKEADAVILFAGVSTTSDQEGRDRHDMTIHGEQNELISKVLAANANTVIVLNNGGPVEMPWIAQAPAVLNAWLPGQEGSAAIADILFGNLSPSGKLPITFPVKLADNPTYKFFPSDKENDKQVTYGEDIFVGYRYYDSKDVEPLFPFGHGLSYTQFDFRNLTVVTKPSLENPRATIVVTVTNTGKTGGAETVQLYVSDPEASVARPLQELKGFHKVALQAGESKNITFKLDKRAFAFWDTSQHDWVVEAGYFDIKLGASSRDIRLKHRLLVE